MTATGRAVGGLAVAAIVAGTALAAAPPAMSAARRAQADAATAGTPARRAGVAGMTLVARGRPAARPAGPAGGLVPAAARGVLSRALGQSDPRYRAVRAGSGWTARNPAQHLAAVFAPGGVTVHAGALAVAMAVRGYGYTSQPGPAGAGRPAAPAGAGNVVRYRQGRLSAWYANGPAGLEQGFTLTAPPPGRARGHVLRLDLAVSGNTRALAAPGGQVIFRHGSQALRYGGLVVTGASGRRLPARIVLRRGGLDLVTDTTGARYPLRIDPVLYTQATLTATDGDGLYSVAVSGATIAAGAPYATVNGNQYQGAVYVFTRAGGTWTQAAKLTASDGAANNYLGYSVAVSGSTIAAGAPGAGAGADGNTEQDAVYVFTRAGGTWTQAAKLTDGAAGDNLGFSVAVSGTTIAAGAPGPYVDDGAGQGAVYVFTQPASGWADETQAAELTASDGAGRNALGYSVAVSGTTIAAGAWYMGENADYGYGAVYVFTQPASGWTDETQAAELTASDGAYGDGLGSSVAVSGATIAAGAPQATVNGNLEQGAVYVFTRVGGTWTQAAQLTASDGAAYNYLGSSVAVSGTTIAAGAPGATVNGNFYQGAVYVFTKPAGGWADETQAAELTASDGADGDGLGYSVAVSGSTIAAADQGVVYLFTKQPVAVSTHLSAAKITAGGHVHDTATLSGATATARGTVDYRYYASYGACRADVAAFTRGTRPSHGISAGTVTVTHAAVPRSRNIRFGRARTWYWAAFYSGDTSNNRAASNCGEKLTVTTPGG